MEGVSKLYVQTMVQTKPLVWEISKLLEDGMLCYGKNGLLYFPDVFFCTLSLKSQLWFSGPLLPLDVLLFLWLSF